MKNKLLITFAMLVLAIFGAACANTGNENANLSDTTTRTAADGSEITTTTDSSGVRTETRVFRNNPRISKVVVTTRDGRRTVRAYSTSGEEREVNDVGDALEVSGDAIADAAGFVADKGEDVADEAADKAEDVGDKAKDVGDKTVSGAKKVGETTAEGAKTVGKKTAEGAKKAGKAIKDAVTP